MVLDQLVVHGQTVTAQCLLSQVAWLLEKQADDGHPFDSILGHMTCEVADPIYIVD